MYQRREYFERAPTKINPLADALLQKPLMSVLIRIIEVEIARLTDQPGLGKRVKQQAQINEDTPHA